MKRMFLVCFCLLLCTCCVAVLAETTECTSHAAACTAPNVCVRCGHVEEGMGIGTGYCDFSVYRYVDKDNHVLACSNCGVYEYSGLTGELELWSHARNCYDTACWGCGATDCNWGFISHNIPDPLVWVDMGEMHGVPCGDCGGYDEPSISEHYAWCTAPDACNECGHANPEQI